MTGYFVWDDAAGDLKRAPEGTFNDTGGEWGAALKANGWTRETAGLLDCNPTRGHCVNTYVNRTRDAPWEYFVDADAFGVFLRDDLSLMHFLRSYGHLLAAVAIVGHAFEIFVEVLKIGEGE